MFLLNAGVRDLCFFPDQYEATAMHKVKHMIPTVLNREAIVLLLKVGEITDTDHINMTNDIVYFMHPCVRFAFLKYCTFPLHSVTSNTQTFLEKIFCSLKWK